MHQHPPEWLLGVLPLVSPIGQLPPLEPPLHFVQFSPSSGPSHLKLRDPRQPMPTQALVSKKEARTFKEASTRTDCM